VPTISGNLIQTLAIGNGVDFTSGIRLDWVTAGSVSNNVIVANSGFTGPGSIGFGIYMHNPARLKITGNTIRAFCHGIYNYTYGGALVSKNTIANNEIIDGQCAGLLFDGNTGGPQIKDNVIQNNKIVMTVPANGSVGVLFTASEDEDMASGNKLIGNTIQGYRRPITVNGDDGITVSGNKISPFSPPGA
jgi:nitrous oxidase accessory protein NosD